MADTWNRRFLRARWPATRVRFGQRGWGVMSRVLVTGGAGFLGSHLTDLMLSHGHHVVGMDNLVTGSRANIAHLDGSADYSFIEHDVSTYIDLDGDVDYILHFASPASPIDYLQLPIQTLKVGALGTHNVLGLARVKGARVVLADRQPERAVDFVLRPSKAEQGARQATDKCK